MNPSCFRHVWINIFLVNKGRRFWNCFATLREFGKGRVGSLMRIFNWLYFCLSMLILCACGAGGSSTTPAPIADAEPGNDSVAGSIACGVTEQIDFVEAVVDSWYLWYRETAVVDKSEYSDPQAYLDARLAPLLAEGRERNFSYLTTITQDETSIGSGAYIGFGFRNSPPPAPPLFIADVFESGPAWDAGVRRGMELLAVDTGSGFETIEELASRGATSEEVFGASEVGVVRGFRLLKGSEEIEVSIAKAELAPPALAGQPLLIESDGVTPVGYVHLRQFIDTALNPEAGYPSLRDAAALFKDAGVTDLIVDLRYNGGGLIRVADVFMDLLGGSIAEGEASFKIQVNDQHPDFNEDRENWGIFDVQAETISPLRVAFITSRDYTASASEMVINGLAPWLEVALIGENTYGKQVGQFRWDMHEYVDEVGRAECDVALRLTSFEIVNGEDMGGYHQVGLDGTGRFTLCSGVDDFSAAFGAREESLVATALQWLEGGTCRTRATASVSPYKKSTADAEPNWLPGRFIPGRRDESLR